MKQLVFIFLSFLFITHNISAQQYSVSSPNGHLKVFISKDNSLHFTLQKDGKTIIPSVEAAMMAESEAIPGIKDKVRKAIKQSVNTNIQPVIAIKNSTIPDKYNELNLQFKNHYSVVFRAYNDAVAYRFETNYPDSITITDERCNISFPQNTTAWFAYNDRWMNSYEHIYKKQPLDSLGKDKTAQLPLLLDLGQEGKVLITESDLYDYPGLYFTGDNTNTLQSVFPPAVKSEVENIRGSGSWDRTFRPAELYDYIARTNGARTFPWRIFAVADRDDQLLNNEIVYKLAAPSRIKDADWIKPGQVAWDWWNDWNITGVDFHAGVNTQTYKYYIDFASRNHIPYIIMDEGWYQLGNMTERVTDVDVKAIADYGKQKGVGVILWCVWRTLDNQMQEAMDLFEQWGIKGIKVDFMDRDDQSVVNFYWRCAEAAARHYLTVDYHGAHKPAGLMRTYPNVVNFEGVPGLEQDKWTDQLATPWMAVTLPYTRMFAGPMDYTPGAMRNAQQKDFRPINDNPMSLGTRCQQLAMYVVFDAPLQMLADNPIAYEKEKDCLDFITSVPTTWDETIPLDGKVGEYVATARRKGNDYFAAAMTNWTARNITIDFSFLPEGTFHMVQFRDGVNAERNGTDYKKVERTITRNDKLTVHLAPGGGWAARIYP
ncbi:MAG: glycoside hydrolase family 97 protein [Bacteroidota bacterium]|nr:glycoside hydrolase family 97 protein [Bacteroidota bacterium]